MEDWVPDAVPFEVPLLVEELVPDWVPDCVEVPPEVDTLFVEGSLVKTAP